MKMRQSGFTILEVLISMAVFAFGLVALIGLQVATIRANTISRQVTEANAIAQTWASVLGTKAYTDTLLSGDPNADVEFSNVLGSFSSSQTYPVSLSSGQHAANNNIAQTFLGGAFAAAGAAGSSQGYELYWGVKDIAFTGTSTAPDLKRIGILVRWKEQSGYYHNVIYIHGKCTGENLRNNISGICR